MKNSLIYLMLFFTAFLNARCQSGKDNEKILDVQNQVFKDWLIDTLVVLKKIPERFGGNLTRTEFVIPPDSLSFELIKTYDFNSIQKVDRGEVSDVLSLLNDYDGLLWE